MNLGKSGVLKRTLSEKKRDNMHNLNYWSEPRVSTQCKYWKAYPDFLEFSISSVTQYAQATQWENVECISILLMQGADPYAKEFRGNISIQHAVSRGSTTIACKLLEYSANTKYNANIKAKTEVKIIQVHSQCTFSNDTQLTFHVLKLRQSH